MSDVHRLDQTPQCHIENAVRRIRIRHNFNQVRRVVDQVRETARKVPITTANRSIEVS